MRRLYLLVSMCCTLTLFPALATAQTSPSGLISPSAARRYGLERAWFTQVELDRSRSRVESFKMHVSSTDFLSVEELIFDDQVIVITDRDLDTFGQPIGADGAKAKALKKKRELEAAGKKVEQRSRLVPEVMVLVQTDRATIHAMNAETGQTLWTTQVGNRNHPTLAPGVNDEFVAVVNGSHLYMLDRATGKQLWERRLVSSPNASPTLSDTHVFAPTTGTTEVYALAQAGPPAWSVYSPGRSTIQPTFFPDFSVSGEEVRKPVTSVSWATDRGFLELANPSSRGELHRRIDLFAPVHGRTAFHLSGILFAATIQGDLHAIDLAEGSPLWRFTTGGTVSETPVVVGDTVYVVTEQGALFSANAITGQEQWWTPRVRRVLAANSNRIYCQGVTGDLLILDARGGGRLGAIDIGPIDMAPTNWQSDRLYLGTNVGTLQCLHETALHYPMVHSRPDQLEKSKPQVVLEAAPADAPAAAAPAGGDPFAPAAGADPFAPAAGADPFAPAGGAPAADPFAPAGGAPAADPFAAPPASAPAADPFAADPF